MSHCDRLNFYCDRASVCFRRSSPQTVARHHCPDCHPDPATDHRSPRYRLSMEAGPCSQGTTYQTQPHQGRVRRGWILCDDGLVSQVKQGPWTLISIARLSVLSPEHVTTKPGLSRSTIWQLSIIVFVTFEMWNFNLVSFEFLLKSAFNFPFFVNNTIFKKKIELQINLFLFLFIFNFNSIGSSCHGIGSSFFHIKLNKRPTGQQ